MSVDLIFTDDDHTTQLALEQAKKINIQNVQKGQAVVTVNQPVAVETASRH